MKIDRIFELQIGLEQGGRSWLAKEKALLTDFLDTFGTLKLKEITTDMLRSWIDRMRVEKNLKESSAYGKKVAINYFFRDLVKKGVLAVSPVEGIHYEKRPIETMRRPIILSESQFEELLKRAKEYSPGVFYPMFRTFVETGAKSQEIIDLTWTCVNFKRGTISFPRGVTLLGREIPVSEELQDMLKRKRPVSEYVFTSVYDERMTKRKISAYINEFKSRYGILDKWMYLDIRYSFAQNFLLKSNNRELLRELLGIRSNQTLQTVYMNRL